MRILFWLAAAICSSFLVLAAVGVCVSGATAAHGAELRVAGPCAVERADSRREPAASCRALAGPQFVVSDCQCGPRRPTGGARYYSMISLTTPEPTVRPPSRMAKRRPWSMAIG